MKEVTPDSSFNVNKRLIVNRIIQVFEQSKYFINLATRLFQYLTTPKNSAEMPLPRLLIAMRLLYDEIAHSFKVSGTGFL